MLLCFLVSIYLLCIIPERIPADNGHDDEKDQNDGEGHQHDQSHRHQEQLMVLKVIPTDSDNHNLKSFKKSLNLGPGVTETSKTLSNKLWPNAFLRKLNYCYVT